MQSALTAKNPRFSRSSPSTINTFESAMCLRASTGRSSVLHHRIHHHDICSLSMMNTTTGTARIRRQGPHHRSITISSPIHHISRVSRKRPEALPVSFPSLHPPAALAVKPDVELLCPPRERDDLLQGGLRAAAAAAENQRGRKGSHRSLPSVLLITLSLLDRAHSEASTTRHKVTPERTKECKHAQAAE